MILFSELLKKPLFLFKHYHFEDIWNKKYFPMKGVNLKIMRSRCVFIFICISDVWKWNNYVFLYGIDLEFRVFIFESFEFVKFLRVWEKEWNFSCESDLCFILKTKIHDTLTYMALLNHLRTTGQTRARQYYRRLQPSDLGLHRTLHQRSLTTERGVWGRKSRGRRAGTGSAAECAATMQPRRLHDHVI